MCRGPTHSTTVGIGCSKSSWLHCEFKASLGYVRPCQRRKKKRKGGCSMDGIPTLVSCYSLALLRPVLRQLSEGRLMPSLVVTLLLGKREGRGLL